MSLARSVLLSLCKISSQITPCQVARVVCTRALLVQTYKTSSIFSSETIRTQDQQVAEQRKRNEDAGEMIELIRDFLDPALFFNSLSKSDINFYCGVPDSLLKDFCAYVTTHVSNDNHVITANEGNAVAMASGYHLATGKYGLVYLQNSGLGNIVNPIMSLAAPGVYSIPMLLLIGWRGEPGKRDEPQHKVQGQATPGLLASLGIPFQTLPDYQEGAEKAIQSAKQYMDTAKGPYALLVKRQTFLPYKLKKTEDRYPLNREQAMKCLVDSLNNKDVVVGTTGMLSRELFEYRVTREDGHERDFLSVGSMGHASALSLGIAMNKPKRQVICVDGDGAVIMHMGAMATIGQASCTNLKHVVINNGAHDSVGGQPTDASHFDEFSFCQIAKGCGYKEAWTVIEEEEIKEAVSALRKMDGPALLEIRTKTGARKDLGRPTRSPLENKEDFMHFLAIG